MARTDRVALARPAVVIRQLEQCVPTLPALGGERCFERLFEVLSEEPDFEYALIDGTIVSVHQKASGAKGGLKIRPSGDQEAA